ncbi:MAG: gluconate 2-dehydrogenase subunit 3 family protein [Pseudomonadales bacterium]
MNRRELLKRSACVLGGVASGTLTHAVLAGVDGRAKIENPLLNAGQRSAVAAIAELIIPQTDTPGAIEAGVPHFIELMVSDWYTPTERKIFLSGLKALGQFCLASDKKDFVACSTEQQIAALQHAEQESKSYNGEQAQFMSNAVDENTPFFTKIKELTVLGYYTSEVGAKQELNYNPMPMKYDGDFDFAEVGRQWSS